MSQTLTKVRAADRMVLRKFSLRNSMNSVAAELTDVISLSRVDPDLPTLLHIVEAGRKALLEGPCMTRPQPACPRCAKPSRGHHDAGEWN